jgi:hypothetical protein
VVARIVIVVALLISAGLSGGCTSASRPSHLAPPSTPTASASSDSLLSRPFVVPTSCSVSAVRYVSIALGGNGIAGYAAGDGPVLPVIGDESRPLRTYKPHHGPALVRKAVVPLVVSQVPHWLAVKTAWVRPPSYRGPYVVRGAQVNGNGAVDIGGSPTRAPFVVNAGPGLNGGRGYRVDPGYLWVRHPGCYALQIVGATFTTSVILDLLPARG